MTEYTLHHTDQPSALAEFRKTPHQLELEEMFRFFHDRSHDPGYHLPHTYSYFEPVILKAVNRFPSSLTLHKCASLLNEEAFFDEGTDTVVHPHISWFPPIWHENHFIVVQIVLEGSITTYIADQELQLKKGNVCIIAPGTRHAISCFSEAYAMKILIRTSTFEQSFFGVLRDRDTVLADFFTRTLYSSNPHPFLFFAGEWDPEMMSVLARAIREGGSRRSFRSQMLNTLMTEFFIMLLRNHEKDLVFPENARVHQNENLIFLLKYVQEHASTITLSELSSLFNYSERHIQRVLHNSTGMSFTQITQSIRMKEAARLLRNTGEPVSKIAADLGYANQGNFRKIFHKTFGLSPAEYRKEKTLQVTPRPTGQPVARE